MNKIKRKCEENMNKLYLLLLLILPVILIGESDSKIELNKLSFNNNHPGVYEKDYLNLPKEKVDIQPNYYMRMSFFAGNKETIASGNGNELLRDITEWKYVENSQNVDSVDISGQKIIIQESKFYDINNKTGKENSGIIVTEKVYKIDGSDAMIFEYEADLANSDLPNIAGCFFDFDIPDKDNKRNPYNDEVIVDNKSQYIYMCNKDNSNESMVPTIFPLQSDISYYVYDVKKEMYNDKKIWETLDGNKSVTGKFNTLKSDYRFKVYRKSKKGDNILNFSFVLFHSYGKKSLENMTSEMDKYILSIPKLSENDTPKEIKELSVPETFIMSSNYPNPFNPSTKFKVSLPESSNLNIQVYDMSGKLIQTIHSGSIASGTHQFEWNAKNYEGTKVASGVYFLRAESAGIVKMNKIMLVR